MADTTQLVNTIIDGIKDKKGRQIVTVDMRDITEAPAAYFVICTAGSPQQADAILDSVEEATGERCAEKPSAIAGRQRCEWAAMDYGTVMVHVFLPEPREYYDLENLWADARIERISEWDAE